MSANESSHLQSTSFEFNLRDFDRAYKRRAVEILPRILFGPPDVTWPIVVSVTRLELAQRQTLAKATQVFGVDAEMRCQFDGLGSLRETGEMMFWNQMQGEIDE